MFWDIVITIALSVYFAGGIATFVVAADEVLTPNERLSRISFIMSLFFLPITVACLALAVLPTALAFWAAQIIERYNVVDWLLGPMFGGKDEKH